MEVHHPHHPTHKKKWTEYIIEFVMLFTAVTMGFFAENTREHMAENNKKRELMKIVSLDIQRDLKQLEFHRKDAVEKLQNRDSLFVLLESDPTKIKLKSYYRSLCIHLAYWNFNSNEKSRNEADSKGYFRNEEDSELAFNLSKYNFFLLDYKTVEEESARLRTKLKDQMTEVAEHKYYNKVVSLELDELPDITGIKPLNPAAAKKVSFIVSDFGNMYNGYIGDIDSLNIYGKKAIDLINKKYN